MWDNFLNFVQTIIALVSSFYLVGIGLSLHAVMRARTSQGAIAWAISLITLPYITVPLYLILGRGRFYGYVEARRKHRHEMVPLFKRLRQEAPLKRHDVGGRLQALERLATLPATSGNKVGILKDGKETFPAMHEAIREAQDYLLVQFYIVRDDHVGRDFADELIRRAEDGVRVYFLYDEIGCYGLSRQYIERLRRGGVHIYRFHTTKGRSNRFQINFRNHRKMVLADGKKAIIGGLNLGKEYNGEDSTIGPWRDTNAFLEGPAVACVQLSFVEDWHWAQGYIPDLFWEPPSYPGGKDVLILPTGPIDDLETCSLFFTHAIHAAHERLWISSPYFVPDSAVISALQLAAMRGVDVRIIIPANPDHKVVYWAGFYFIDLIQKAGVKVYRYQKGFMHHKVMLVDNRMAAIGSANIDNRSFRLNFEITMATFDEAFAGEVHRMLQDDLKQCRVTEEPLDNRKLWFRMLVKLARLFAPIL